MLKQDISKNVEERIKQAARPFSVPGRELELESRTKKFRKLWKQYCDEWEIEPDFKWAPEAHDDVRISRPWIFVNKQDWPPNRKVESKTETDKLGREMGKKREPQVTHMADLLRFAQIPFPDIFTPGYGNPWHNIGGEGLMGVPLRKVLSLRNRIEGPGANYVFIEIHPWTCKEDLNDIWKEIEKGQKWVFGNALKNRKRTTFGRDFCFYDLHTDKKKYGKLSDGDISNRWYDHTHPHQRVQPEAVTKARLRIDAAIKALELETRKPKKSSKKP